MYIRWLHFSHVAGHIDLGGAISSFPQVPGKNSIVNNPVVGQIHVYFFIWGALPPSCPLQLQSYSCLLCKLRIQMRPHSVCRSVIKHTVKMAFEGTTTIKMETDDTAFASFHSNTNLRRWNSSPMINNSRVAESGSSIERTRRSGRTRTFSASMYHVCDSDRMPSVITVRPNYNSLHSYCTALSFSCLINENNLDV